MTVTHHIKFNTVKIYINGSLHLSFFKTKKVTVESWIEGQDHYIIEVWTGDFCLLCEYDNREKWIAILAVLDQVIP
jgi:hypothetical protein